MFEHRMGVAHDADEDFTQLHLTGSYCPGNFRVLDQGGTGMNGDGEVTIGAVFNVLGKTVGNLGRQVGIAVRRWHVPLLSLNG